MDLLILVKKRHRQPKLKKTFYECFIYFMHLVLTLFFCCEATLYPFSITDFIKSMALI